MSLIIGKVTGLTSHGTTSNANPDVSVELLTPRGDIVTRRFSSDAIDAYGASNLDRRERFHAYRLTDAGRIVRIDRDATHAYRFLDHRYPDGATLATLTTGRTVRVLRGDSLAGVDDVSWAVAAVTPYRFDQKRGGVIVPGVGVVPSAGLASMLSRVMGRTLTARGI